MKYATLLACTSLVAACLAVSPTASAAQGERPEENEEKAAVALDDIIVTARKVDENLQDVPVAITSFSGDALEKQNAVEVADVARLTPGFTIKKSNSTAAAINLQIRGQYQADVLATVDPSVGTYVDGYYWARAYGLSADLLDVQSVQVLRGPQGTLFGRNTTGGALIVQTNEPDTNHFSGLISGSYGRFDERAVTAVINLPIITDGFAVRGAVTMRKRDGHIAEQLSGQRIAGTDSWTGRIKLLARATDHLSLLLSAERFEIDAITRPYELAYVGSNSAANLQAALQRFGASASADRLPQGRALIADHIANGQSPRNVTLNELPRTKAKTETYTGTATLETTFGAIKMITGYRRVRADASLDLDGSPFAIIRTDGHQDLEQFSSELQFTGKVADDVIEFAGGLFYFEENGFDRSASTALPALSPNPTNFSDGVIDTRSQGLYGQLTAHLSDALSVTGGLRYSIDDKGLTIRNRRLIAATGDFSCNVLGGTPPPECAIRRSDDFSGLSYTFGADYRAGQDLLFYIKTSKGFRSGGQNLRAQGDAGASFIPFRPEISYETEFGMKSEFLDRRVRLNISAFYNRVNDIQRSTLVTTSDPVTGQVTTATIVGNAGKVRIYGGEAELTARLFNGFTLSSAVALIKPKYLVYIDPNSGVDRRNERFEQVPEWTASMGATYEREFNFGTVLIRGDYSWQSKTALISYFEPLDPDNDLIAGLSTQKGGTMNLRLGYRSTDGNFEIALFGRNVLNREDAVNALFFTPPLSALAIQRRDPASYGITATFRFGAH